MAQQFLENLIKDFSIENLTLFFRHKLNTFRPDEEDFDYLFEDDDQVNERFTDIMKLGEADLNDSNDILVFSTKSVKNLTDRSGKKIQYNIAKKILKEEDKDATFFIFYDDGGNFRFSLIRANFIGTRRQFTDFKRYTYYVSPDLTNKTFISQISKANFNDLDDIQEAFSVEPLTKQFYEKLQHWYFWAIDTVRFPEDAEKETNGREIAIIRMITRIMFIWFMKVRNLIPNELFDEDYIDDILKDTSPEESTYYKAILQNLFFATLNTKQENRKFRSEKRNKQGYNPDYGNQNVFRYHDLFKDANALIELFEKIPFLNGGLFECLDYKPKGEDKDNRKYIDGFTATKSQQPVVPNELFFSDIQDKDISKFYGKNNKLYNIEGLLNILKYYNFTIDENEPGDIEVALDPELLGSIFENLLASYNPETATTARKATGSFYTPREIVNYMTNESLKQYFLSHLEKIPDLEDKLDSLIKANNSDNPFNEAVSQKITELIDDLRIVDPAVGSGAFPMAVLNKLVFILSKVDPDNRYWKDSQINGVKKAVKDPVTQRKLIQHIEEQFREKNADYGRKLYLIEKCIYGVDIQQIAVEIAKLRFFISLLVDEKIEFDNPGNNFGIEALPNLDFKLMQGNSLISSYLGYDFDNEDDNSENILFKTNGKFDELIKEFEELKNEYQNVADKIYKSDLRHEIEQYILKIFEYKLSQHVPELKLIQEKAKYFPTEKAQKEYISKEKHKLTEKLGFDIEEKEKELIEYTEGRKPKNFFLWNIYFAEVFTEKKGFDIVIGNPPYIMEDDNRKAFDGLHDTECYEGKTDLWHIFSCCSIDLLRENGILSFIAKNQWFNSMAASKMRKKIYSETNIKFILDFGANLLFENAGQQTMVFLLLKTVRNLVHNIEYYRFDVMPLPNLKQRIYEYDFIFENKKIPKNYDEKNNLSFSKNDQLLDKISYFKNVEFEENEITQGIIGGPDKSFIVFDSNLDSFSDKEKNFIKNYHTNTERYSTNNSDKYIFYLCKKNFENKNINEYPNIREYFQPNKKDLILRKIRYETPDKPYFYLHRDRNEKFFIKGAKLVWAKRTEGRAFTYTDKPFYGSANLFFLKSNKLNLKYLAALLNSKVMFFYMKERLKHTGDLLQIDKNQFLKIPIYKMENTKLVELLVDKIINKKIEKISTQKEEDIIDLYFCKSYDLTYDEVKIIDPDFEMTEEEYENFKIEDLEV